MRDDAATEAAVISVAAAGKRRGGRGGGGPTELEEKQLYWRWGRGAAPQQTRAGRGWKRRQGVDLGEPQPVSRPAPSDNRPHSNSCTDGREGWKEERARRAGIERSYTRARPRGPLADTNTHAKSARAGDRCYTAQGPSRAVQRREGREGERKVGWLEASAMAANYPPPFF